MERPYRTIHKVVLLGLAFLLSSAAFGPHMTAAQTTSAESSEGDDWIISRDTILDQSSKDVGGKVIVRSNATLTLHGSELRVGELIQIEPGASLEAGPAAGVPTVIAALRAQTGFWIDVNGTMTTGGTPATTFRGLSGQGIAALFNPVGGIQVNGRVNLDDVVIMDGTAGIVVQQAGELTLRNAIVERLNEIGVAVHGRAELDNVTIRHHSLMAVAGREPCDIHVEDSRIEYANEGVLVNSCRALIERTNILRTGVGVSATGSAALTLIDSRIEEYQHDGVHASAQPDRELPRMHLENVDLVPGSEGQRGAEFLNAGPVVFRNVTADDHALVGIQASGTDLIVEHSAFRSNGAYGILAAGGHLDVNMSTTDFGSFYDVSINPAGAVRYDVLLRAYAVDATGSELLPGYDFEVFRAATGDRVFNGTDQRGVMLARFEGFDQGGYNFLGPFTYRATFHSGAYPPLEGPLTALGEDLVLQPSAASALDDPSEPGSTAVWIGVAAGAVLLTGLVFIHPRLRERIVRIRK